MGVRMSVCWVVVGGYPAAPGRLPRMGPTHAGPTSGLGAMQCRAFPTGLASEHTSEGGGLGEVDGGGWW